MNPKSDHAPFWEHAEELRLCLVKGITAIAIASLFAFFFYPKLIALLTAPYQNIESQGSIGLTSQKIETFKVTNDAPEPVNFALPLKASVVSSLTSRAELLDHHTYRIAEKGHLVYTQPVNNEKLVILSPTEGLMTAIKVSLWIGLALSSPVWLYFLLSFVAPALQSNERQILAPFFTLTFLFFSLGLFFCYTLSLPLANNYLALFNAGIGKNLWTLSHYLDYTLVLMLANGIAFESAVVLFCLVHYGIITAEAMRRKRRFAIVSIFIIAAILTPPDVVTQLLLAIPLCLIYEAALFYASCRHKPTVSLQSKP